MPTSFRFRHPATFVDRVHVSGCGFENSDSEVGSLSRIARLAIRESAKEAVKVLSRAPARNRHLVTFTVNQVAESPWNDYQGPDGHPRIGDLNAQEPAPAPLLGLACGNSLWDLTNCAVEGPSGVPDPLVEYISIGGTHRHCRHARQVVRFAPGTSATVGADEWRLIRKEFRVDQLHGVAPGFRCEISAGVTSMHTAAIAVFFASRVSTRGKRPWPRGAHRYGHPKAWWHWICAP